MQKIVSIIIVVLLILGVIIFSGFTNDKKENADLFRIHIIANSNLQIDSEVKYKIKDEYSKFLTPMLANCECKKEVNQIIESNLSNLKIIADGILKESGLNYLSKLSISNEYFPTRAYGDYVVESGYYDGITVTLGEGKGDNWWCIMFPPLCYYNATATNYNQVVYKSKILDIIKQFFAN